jgi:hypothetical protein
VAKNQRNPETLTKPFALLVEGGDDHAVVGRLLQARALSTQQNLDIFEYDGKDKLRPFLKGFCLLEGFRTKLRSFGIFRDADQDHLGAVQSVRDAIRHASLQDPPAELQKTAGTPSVCFLILPGGGALGMLEDVCLTAVAGEALYPDANAFIDAVSVKTANPPQPRSKAVIHSFLATRGQPGLPLGKASEAGYIDLHHVAFNGMAQLVQLVTAP